MHFYMCLKQTPGKKIFQTKVTEINETFYRQHGLCCKSLSFLNNYIKGRTYARIMLCPHFLNLF